jgi:hypothetical protein
MWNDWLSSLNGPSTDSAFQSIEVPEPIETPRRFTNPAQIERLQSLQTQHQQLQVQQLHLLTKQFKLQREAGISFDSTCGESASSGAATPIGNVSAALAEVVKSQGVLVSNSAFKADEYDSDDEENVRASHLKSEEGETVAPSDSSAFDEAVHPEVWKQFHALQAQQWAQALNQARIAKRQTSSAMLSPSSISGGIGSLMHASANSMSGGKRCKAYAAPKGVWKNNGGYNATIYVHKRRIYGPIRRDLSDAIEDRKEMEDALRELTQIHNTPEDAGILEVEMREVVAGLRNRATPNRDILGSTVSASAVPSSNSVRLLNASASSNLEGSTRKRLRLVGTGQTGVNEGLESSSLIASPDALGPFASPLQVKPDADDDIVLPSGLMYDHSDDDVPPAFHMRGFTPSVGPMYGSPAPMFGAAPSHSYLGDDGVDMLPDSGLNSLWG